LHANRPAHPLKAFWRSFTPLAPPAWTTLQLSIVIDRGVHASCEAAQLPCGRLWGANHGQKNRIAVGRDGKLVSKGVAHQCLARLRKPRSLELRSGRVL